MGLAYYCGRLPGQFYASFAWIICVKNGANDNIDLFGFVRHCYIEVVRYSCTLLFIFVIIP